MLVDKSIKENSGMKKMYFPSNNSLEESVIETLHELGGLSSVTQINCKVIEILELPEEVVKLEDESGIGTKLNYRLRWSRTNLKNRGLIKNEGRGMWRLL